MLVIARVVTHAPSVPSCLLQLRTIAAQAQGSSRLGPHTAVQQGPTFWCCPGPDRCHMHLLQVPLHVHMGLCMVRPHMHTLHLSPATCLQHVRKRPTPWQHLPTAGETPREGPSRQPTQLVVNLSQAAPLNPWLHTQVPLARLHTPFRLQSLGHALGTGNGAPGCAPSPLHHGTGV